MDEKTRKALEAMGQTVPDETESSGEMADLDALLNQSLDDIPEVADFVVPKEGVYQLHVEKVDKNKEINEKRTIQFDYAIVECLQERGTDTGDSVKPGDKFSEAYFVGSKEQGAFVQGLLKKLLAPVAARFSTSNLGTTIDAYAGCNIAATIKHRRNKDDKSIVYPRVTKIVFMD